MLVGILGVASAVHARPTVRDDLRRDAREQWDAARELHDAGDYDTALVYFTRAYELSKDPRVLFNIGVCWKDMSKYSEAIRIWQRQLSFRKKLRKDDVKKAEAAISALRRFVSTMTVVADEADARLSVDGVEVGVTPFVEPIMVDVGSRSLRLEKPGFEPLEKKIEIARGKVASVEFDLQHEIKTGEVTVVVEGPEESIVYMDGREIGPAPFNGPLPAGSHTFEAKADGYVTGQQTADVIYQKSLKVTLWLSESMSNGKLRVVTAYPDAQIRIDGSIVGRGAWEGLLAAGGHQLEVSKAGYSTRQLEVTLAPKQQRTLEVDLSSERSWLFWTISVAAVVGGGTLATVLLTRPTETTPVDGTLANVVAF